MPEDGLLERVRPAPVRLHEVRRPLVQLLYHASPSGFRIAPDDVWVIPAHIRHELPPAAFSVTPARKVVIARLDHGYAFDYSGVT